jgi:hypothetical protein
MVYGEGHMQCHQPFPELCEGVCTSASHTAGVWMDWMVDPAAGERAHALEFSLSVLGTCSLATAGCCVMCWHLELCHVMSVSAVNDGSRLHTC